MKRLFTISIAALALLACSREQMPQMQGGEGSVISFKANIPNTFELKSTTPLEGKNVRIVADATLDGATTVATVAGNALNTETTLRWKVNQTANTTFAGLYQSVEGGAAPDAPTGMKVEYNMINGDVYNYDYHSSYLTAVAKDVVPETTPVNLTFKHPFSKLTISITNNLADGATVKSVNVRDVYLSGNINLATDAVELTGTKTAVDAVKVGDNYEVIIMPQTTQLSLAITVTKDDVDRSYFFTLSESKEFEMNKSYTGAVTLTSDTPVGTAVGFTFTYTDWVVDENPISTVDVTDKWVVVGTNCNTNVVMTQTTTGEEACGGVWEADITYAPGDKFYLRYGASTEAKMNSEWQYCGLDFDAGLWGTGGVDIILGTGYVDNAVVPVEAGTYHLKFTYTGYLLRVTETN